MPLAGLATNSLRLKILLQDRILAAAEDDRSAMERTVECFRGFLDCLEGAEEKGVIYGTGAWKAGEIRQLPAMKQARIMGIRV